MATIKQSSVNNFLFTEVKYTFEFTPLSNSRASGGSSIIKPQIVPTTQPQTPSEEDYANTPESKSTEIKTKIQENTVYKSKNDFSDEIVGNYLKTNKIT